MSPRLAFPEFAPGSVWLVGAGPGDPGLLTLHAAHALSLADVILHDALVAPEMLALADPAAAFEPVGKRVGRPGRAQHIARYLDLLLALLPFEPPWFERHGLRCLYVGHPVVETIPRDLDAAGFRARHGIAPQAPLLVMLPGSRRSEVGHLTPVFGAAIERLAARIPGLRVAVPTVATVPRSVGRPGG